uniref:Ig-like domain-containing protein n=1 Tax=Amphiprion percula TaxID=161767 RepID=A0A3P8TJT3_AMPPE
YMSTMCICFVSRFTSAQMNHLNISSLVHQDRGFLSANTGDSVTLQCFYRDDILARFYWYKQIPGQKLRLISMFHKYETEATFYDEFKSNPRFSLDTEKGKNHLMITDVHTSDTATYYCAGSYSYTFELAEGTTLNVKGSGLNFQTLVQQSTSKTIQPGDAVTLNCTVHTGTCDGEHSVYWFKTEEESYPGLFYTHGGRDDHCEKELNTQMHICVYNLPLKSLNLSDVGTYYSAVASCGHILFGNGTKLDFEGIQQLRPCHVSYCDLFHYQNYKTEENLHYAAARVKKANRSRRHREETENKCLYSIVKA